MYGRGLRKYRIDRVISDIRSAEQHGAKALFIVDDNITADVGRFEEICDAIAGEGLSHIHYVVQASVKGISSSRTLVRKMAAAGFKCVFLGIENVSGDNLNFLGKEREISEMTRAAVAYLREERIILLGGFMLGNPDDSEGDFWENYRYARSLRIDGPFFFVITPHLKTELRHRTGEESGDFSFAVWMFILYFIAAGSPPDVFQIGV